MLEEISEKGFVILKNSIEQSIIDKVHSKLFSILSNKLVEYSVTKEQLYNLFNEKISLNTLPEYDYALPFFNQLLFENCFEDILTNGRLYKFLTDLLGRDLSFCTDPSITINIPKKDSSDKNYLFKDWHQEIWSGASPSTFQIWTPLIHKNSNHGQMELIVGSHKWGHIPHRNRSPISLPKNFDTQTLNLEYGDVIIFSTLLLHRSVKTIYPRMSLPMLLKNFKYVDNSFQNNRNWKIFSYSEMTKIEKILGNHYLSPFRTTE